MNLIEKYYAAFSSFGEKEAFCAGDEKYSYREFLFLINGSRRLLESQNGFEPQMPVGVLCNEFAETYAAVFAIWFSGGVFMPLNPEAPTAVNEELIGKFGIKYVFQPDGSGNERPFQSAQILDNQKISSEHNLPVHRWSENRTLYVLNTSGSTGMPKNVAISLKNLSAYVEGFLKKYPELDSSDKFLQTYELTADASFTGYLIPFLLGAEVYTIPGNTFKPFAAAKILSEKPITWVKATPTLLACLKPFFSSFHLPGLKHFHFGGEALPADLVESWRPHIPNAEISNGYGPTETTVTATIYKCLPGEKIKEKNNIVSIGLPFKHVQTYISKMPGERNDSSGELWIGGQQMMNGYLESETQPFKFIEKCGQSVKYYPTGDLVAQDHEGYLYFLGRLDDQVKINAYRIDLIEIENAVRKIVPDSGNVAAVAVEKSPGLKQLVVFIEKYSGCGKEIQEEMALSFQRYKIPEKIIGVLDFPVNRSGKTDKKKLVAMFLNKELW